LMAVLSFNCHFLLTVRNRKSNITIGGCPIVYEFHLINGILFILEVKAIAAAEHFIAVNEGHINLTLIGHHFNPIVG